jgi:long-chain fatty acid transport protein
MTCRWLSAGLAPMIFLMAMPPGYAANGIFTHGSGVKSAGAGGVSYVAAQDSYPVSANPALAHTIENRFDFGLDYLRVSPLGRIEGNLLGPNHTYKSNRHHFFIPQFGFVRHLSERLTMGASGFAAGFGTDYLDSPYERFGGAERTSLSLAQAGASGVVAFAPVPGQSLGLGINLGYQVLEGKGLDAFAFLSESPDKFSNQGKEGGFSGGFTLGWNGLLAPWLEVGAAYRSKVWAQRLDDYAGLLPDQGKLELPAMMALGVALTPVPRWTIALEAHHFRYEDEKITGNTIDELRRNGHRLGSDDGPGFGWRNQTIYKIGVNWTVTPSVQLRAGYSYADPILVRSSDTFLAPLAPNTTRSHYTLGATVDVVSGWEMSSYLSYGQNHPVHGDRSIPLLVLGGEMTTDNQFYAVGVSLGRRW